MKYVLLTESLSDDMCVEINDNFVGLTGILVTSFIGKNNMLTKEVVNCSYYLSIIQNWQIPYLYICNDNNSVI